jgi:hypothetical protein
VTITNTTHTFSFYAKAKEFSWVAIGVSGFAGATVTGTCYYDLANGVVGGFNQISGTITSVGNGWYRCTGIVTPVVSDLTGTFAIYVAEGNNDIVVDKSGTSGIFIWGAQLEAAAFSTSYIQTVASQVTRAADSASMTGTNFTSWFNNAEFSLYQDIQFQTGSPVRLGDTFANNVETIRNNTFSAQIVASFGNTAFTSQSYSIVNSPSYPVSAFVANQRQVAAFAMSLNSFASGYSGAGATATPTYNPAAGTFSGLYFGGTNLGANFTGRIRKIAFYPKALTATNLQALTG